MSFVMFYLCIRHTRSFTYETRKCGGQFARERRFDGFTRKGKEPLFLYEYRCGLLVKEASFTSTLWFTKRGPVRCGFRAIKKIFVKELHIFRTGNQLCLQIINNYLSCLFVIVIYRF